MGKPLPSAAIAIPLTLLAASARAEASYEAAGRTFAVLICWILIAAVICVAVAIYCIHKRSALPLVVPLVYVTSTVVLTLLVLSLAPLLPEPEIALLCATIVAPLIAGASAWIAVAKRMRQPSHPGENS
jgi:hypothetical protein